MLKTIAKYLMLLIVATACNSYKTIAIDILVPADYSIDPRSHSAMLLDNTMPLSKYRVHKTFKRDVSAEGKLKFISDDDIKIDSLAQSCLYNMYNNLTSPAIFDTIYLEARDHLSSINGSISKQYPVDVVISLDTLSYREELYNVSYSNYYDLGQKVIVSVDSRWNVRYSSALKAPSYAFSVLDTFHWESWDLDRVECVSQAIWDVGKQAADKIAPYWKSVNRYYNVQKSYSSNMARDFVSEGNWDAAAAIWFDLFESYKDDNVKKGYMAFNITLYFEVMNDLDGAFEWLEKAEQIFGENKNSDESNICKRYRKVLELRLRHKVLLDKQFVIH
jgi:hypothetical protein